MGLLKLILAVIALIAFFVIISDAIKRRRKEQVVADLTDELDAVNSGLERTDIEETIVEAKTALKERRAKLAEKNEDLAKPVAPKKKAAPKKS